MSKQSEKTKQWRKRTKSRMVEAMGGGCCICGYRRCLSALALHHINPKEKDFGFGRVMAHIISWSRIVVEIRKCILVCHNCHSEIHEGVVCVPADAPKFNETFVTYKIIRTKKPRPQCRGCEKELERRNKTGECRKCRAGGWEEANKGKKRRTKRSACSSCGTAMWGTSKTGLCRPCYTKTIRKVERPSREVLVAELAQSNYSAMGRKYGVSDNAIRKWLR